MAVNNFNNNLWCENVESETIFLAYSSGLGAAGVVGQSVYDLILGVGRFLNRRLRIYFKKIYFIILKKTINGYTKNRVALVGFSA